MLFRTWCSIEFQGPCSRNLNLTLSENCIFGIYGPYAFYRFLIQVSLHIPWRKKAGYSRCIIEKDVQINIILFRTWCSIKFQGPSRRNMNLTRSQKFVFLESTVHKLIIIIIIIIIHKLIIIIIIIHKDKRQVIPGA
jgi:hypothetical protein